ncbi:hypothetical protein CDAR_484481 [Caerostris darwini]|uniref:Uncharacterized protein n=1 Tax=Caerostris darwini TaxID=1538125 RepID=A0AAV4TV53_9ARAC|nr:hypothetical protein CDAR_484481 [Caerostris darwini]
MIMDNSLSLLVFLRPHNKGRAEQRSTSNNRKTLLEKKWGKCLEDEEYLRQQIRDICPARQFRSQPKWGGLPLPLSAAFERHSRSIFAFMPPFPLLLSLRFLAKCDHVTREDNAKSRQEYIRV